MCGAIFAPPIHIHGAVLNLTQTLLPHTDIESPAVCSDQLVRGTAQYTVQYGLWFGVLETRNEPYLYSDP
jgi:hypothetical protein